MCHWRGFLTPKTAPEGVTPRGVILASIGPMFIGGWYGRFDRSWTLMGTSPSQTAGASRIARAPRPGSARVGASREMETCSLLHQATRDHFPVQLPAPLLGLFLGPALVGPVDLTIPVQRDGGVMRARPDVSEAAVSFNAV